jgi:hypothetical protein
MKKSALFLTGIFGVLLVLSFVLTGCPTDAGDPDNTPTVSAVTVSPATPGIVKSRTQHFTAVVTGTNSPDQTVIWTVEGGVTGTTINASGDLAVAAGESAATLTVRATSTVDDAKSGTATVAVTSSSSSSPGTSTWWRGRYAYGSDYVDLTTGSVTLVTVKICQQIPQYGLVFTYFSHTKWQMLSYLSIEWAVRQPQYQTSQRKQAEM